MELIAFVRREREYAHRHGSTDVGREPITRRNVGVHVRLRHEGAARLAEDHDRQLERLRARNGTTRPEFAVVIALHEAEAHRVADVVGEPRVARDIGKARRLRHERRDAGGHVEHLEHGSAVHRIRRLERAVGIPRDHPAIGELLDRLLIRIRARHVLKGNSVRDDRQREREEEKRRTQMAHGVIRGRRTVSYGEQLGCSMFRRPGSSFPARRFHQWAIPRSTTRVLSTARAASVPLSRRLRASASEST
jgi:hypothetical protein